MKLYFAYGANLNTESMRYRCPDAVEVMPFYLADYRLTFSGVASIQPAKGEFVAGALWAISEEDERALDCFEGWPMLYRKEIITADGMEIMFYRMNDERPSEPSINYVMTIAEGYQDWDLDLSYLTEAVATTQGEVYDLYRSTHNTTGHGGLHPVVEDDVYMESGDDVRWLRDVWHADRDTDTVQ